MWGKQTSMLQGPWKNWVKSLCCSFSTCIVCLLVNPSCCPHLQRTAGVRISYANRSAWLIIHCTVEFVCAMCLLRFSVIQVTIIQGELNWGQFELDEDSWGCFRADESQNVFRYLQPSPISIDSNFPGIAPCGNMWMHLCVFSFACVSPCFVFSVSGYDCIFVKDGEVDQDRNMLCKHFLTIAWSHYANAKRQNSHSSITTWSNSLGMMGIWRHLKLPRVCSEV